MKSHKEDKFLERYLAMENDDFKDRSTELLLPELDAVSWFFGSEYKRDQVDGGLECTDDKLISA